MTEACKKILEELDRVEWDNLAYEAGIDMIEFLNEFDENNDDSTTLLGHFVQSVARFLRSSVDRKMRRLCRRLILALAELGDPEDMILTLTEEVEFEEEVDTQEVAVLIECIKIAVARLPRHDHHPITWCFNAIIRHMNTLTELPEEHNLEGEEKILLDSDPNVIVIKTLYIKILDFIGFVIENVLPHLTISPEERTEMNDAVVLFLLKLLGKPMSYMDLEIHSNKRAINSFRSYCVTIIDYVSGFGLNLLRFLDCADCKVENADSVVDHDYSYLSLGTFYYLIFHEGIRLDEVVQVYSKIYIFKCVLEHALVMMEISSNLVQRKGLLLCYSCIKDINPYSLKKCEISWSALSKFSEVLPAIMVYSELKENRQLAVKIFRHFIFCLDSVGRYTILINIPKISTNSGFVGFATTIVKDIVVSYLSTDNQEDRLYFSGKHLADILKNFTKLPQGVETDIAENSDSIISILNFLRYLILKDTTNQTGIWDLIEMIEKDFLKPLKEAVDISKAHYQLEIKNTDKGNPQTPVSISVGGQNLPNLSVSEKKNILNNAINTFDLIDSLRVRVVESIQSHNYQTTQIL